MHRGVARNPAIGRAVRPSSLAPLAAILAVLGSCEPAPSTGAPPEKSAAATASGTAGAPARTRGAPVPPPLAGATWGELARWAADSYAALGFEDAPRSVRVDVLDEADPRELLDHAAREFALDVLDAGARAQTDTHWILRRAFDAAAATSPEEELSLEAQHVVYAIPMWYDRRLRAVRVIGGHPLLTQPHGSTAWQPWHLMAHEVAHALQDRRAPFRDARAEPDTYEANVVRKCLFEGEADLRMLALDAALDGRDLVTAGAEWCTDELQRLFDRASPSYYDAGFRYLLGELYAGGWPAVERAVTSPEVTSRDLLTGERAPRRPVSLVLPAWPADVAVGIDREWRDEVGAWGILSLLADAGHDEGDCAELLSAWRADELAVARRADGITALMWRVIVADEDSARALAELFASSEGTASFAGTTVDLAWSPVKQIELEVLERLEAAR